MKRRYIRPSHPVARWFRSIFLVLSLVFCIALAPLFVYLQNTFVELQMEKISHQLDSGAAELDNVLTGILNIKQALSKDAQYISFYLAEGDYSQLTIEDRNQLKRTFHSLVFPYDIITDAALQFGHNVAITPNTVFFEGSASYYPTFFRVDGLNFAQWEDLLETAQSGFLPVSRVTTYTDAYDALIYAVRWMKSTYLYACMDVEGVKQLLFEDAQLDGRWFTLARTDGTPLYSDLPATPGKYQTLTRRTAMGNLEISIHIDDAVFFQRMKPLSLFLIIYGCICLMMLALTVVTGTRISSKPLIGIVEALERSQHIPDDASASGQKPFEYISDRISQADAHLGQYQQTIDTQRQVLQARFFETALNGALTAPQDMAHFRACFPDFPAAYSLLLLRIQSYDDSAPDLNPMLILQSFLQRELPGIYQQILNDSQLLLLMEQSAFETYRGTLDELIHSINCEEPSYVIRCVASPIYYGPESLCEAFRQIRDMDAIAPAESWYRVHTMDDCSATAAVPFSMAEMMQLYAAIVSGSADAALAHLRHCSDRLAASANESLFKTVCQVAGAVLTAIKLEYPTQLINESIPDYRTGKAADLYALYSGAAERFCAKLRPEPEEELPQLTRELLHYIDASFTDCNLCVASLEERFKCSASTIRKAFKKGSDLTVAAYIEHKRLTLASDLLAKRQHTVAEIAEECGFSSPNSFYKAYKRKYGHAPTQGT